MDRVLGEQTEGRIVVCLRCGDQGARVDAVHCQRAESGRAGIIRLAVQFFCQRLSDGEELAADQSSGEFFLARPK